MAARPGQEYDSWRVKTLAQLAVVYATVVDLIQRGKRGQQTIEVLLRALQAAREGTLAGIVLKATSKDNLQAVLSLLVSETGMAEHLKKYLAQRGVRYIGEIYQLIWDRRGARVQEVRTEVFTFLKVSLGLPEFVDLATVWCPPYWDDTGFLAALIRPIGQAVKNQQRSISWDFSRRQERDHQNQRWYLTTTNRWQHARHTHYAGQWLVGRDFGVGQMKDKQSMLLPNSGLWAAALLPPNWNPPTEVPEEWTRELEVIEGEKEKARERAQLKAAQRRDRIPAQAVPRQIEPVSEHASISDFYERLRTDLQFLENVLRPVNELELSVRTANCLQNLQIRLLGQLLPWTEAELLKTKNFGRKSLKEIKEILGEMGLGLNMVPSEHRDELRRAIELRLEGQGIGAIASYLRSDFPA